MTATEKLNLRTFLLQLPFAVTSRGLMATVWMQPDAIHPDCIPDGVHVDEVMWDRVDEDGCVPVRLVRKP